MALQQQHGEEEEALDDENLQRGGISKIQQHSWQTVSITPDHMRQGSTVYGIERFNVPLNTL